MHAECLTPERTRMNYKHVTSFTVERPKAPGSDVSVPVDPKPVVMAKEKSLRYIKGLYWRINDLKQRAQRS